MVRVGVPVDGEVDQDGLGSGDGPAPEVWAAAQEVRGPPAVRDRGGECRAGGFDVAELAGGEEVEVLGGAGHDSLGDERAAAGEQEPGRLGEGEEGVGQLDLELGETRCGHPVSL